MNEVNATSDRVRKLWDKEIEIYLYFKEFCRKHGLRYYAVGGTALGAVRHKGFIPWDDDMDFAMPHEDYQRFLELGSKELPWPYYLSCHLSDPVRGGILCSRLRRVDTTACSQFEYERFVKPGDREYKLGVWIDVLPLSYIPEDEETRRIQKEQIMEVYRAVRGFSAYTCKKTGFENYNHEFDNYIDTYLEYSKKYSLVEMKQLYLDLCGQNKEPTEFIGVTAFRTFQPNLIWRTEWFKEAIELPFENITVTCPIGIEEMLTKQYGDWRIPVRNAAYHEIYMFDTETPYLEMTPDMYEKMKIV